MLWKHITILCHRATESPGPKNSQCQIKTYHLFHCPNSRLKQNQNYSQKSVYQCLHNDTTPWAAEHFREFLEGRGQRMSPGSLRSWKPPLSTPWGTIRAPTAGARARRGQQHPCLIQEEPSAQTPDLTAVALFFLQDVCVQSHKHTENIKCLAQTAHQSLELW